MTDIPPIQFWPDSGKAKRGPNDLQKRYFINRMPPDQRPHWHSQDVLVSIGGYGSGKSLGLVTCILDACLIYKNVRAMIGGIDLQLLKRNTIPSIRDIFTNEEEWDHPAVRNQLTDKQTNLRFYNGSDLTLVNLTQFLKVVGANVGIFGVEEPHLLPNGEDSFITLLGRLRSTPPEVRQLILCTNPEKSKQGWMNSTFELHLFDGIDTSEKPLELLVGKGCECQICTKCKLSWGKEFEWKQDLLDNFWYCPNCKSKRDFWTWKGEKFYCPGNQQYTRVIKSESMHNPHLPDDYFQGMADKYDPIMFQIMVKGQLNTDLRDDYVYKDYNDKINKLLEDRPVDYSKDLLWGLDFNLKPQCSSISQVEEIEGKEYLVVKDEIILYGPSPEEPYGGAQATDVANEFVRRFKPNYLGTTVQIFGDPKGYGGTSMRELTRYQQIYNILTANGFNVNIVADHKNIPLKERIDNVNELLDQGKILVNPSCPHVIKSFEELKWKESTITRDELDSGGDNNARRSHNRTKVYCMTHPTDGLGYMIYKLFPILKNLDGERFAIFPGRATIEERPDGTAQVTKDEITIRMENEKKEFLSINQLNAKIANQVEEDINRINNQSMKELLGDLKIIL